MTPYEIAALIVSGISLAFAAVSFFVSLNANKKSSSASVELTIHDAITSATEKIMDCSADMDKLNAKNNRTEEEESELQMKKSRFNVAVENYLNAYEVACAKYIDNKIDKARFEKLYTSCVQKIVENPKFKKYFDAVTSRYKAILKVYKEWFDKENK